MKFGFGQPVSRVEDQKLIYGAGEYTDDILPGQTAHIVFLRSPFAHARLTHLDLTEARAAPGVLLAAAQADLDADNVGDVQCQYYVKNKDGSEITKTSKPAMIRDICRYAGDIVAMVVAKTREQAQDALELIEVDFDPMDSVCDIRAAVRDDAPQLYPEYPNNTVFNWAIGAIDETDSVFDAAKASGKRIITMDTVNNRVAPSAMETRPMVAMPDPDNPDGLKIWTGTQGPLGIAKQIAQSLDMKTDDVHVLTGNVGGGFGFKIFLHPEQLIIAWAARKAGQAIRWQQARSEAFLSDLQGRDNFATAEAVVSETGKVEALRVSIMNNLGAWLSNYGVFVPTTSTSRTLTGIYDIQVAAMHVTGVVTNTPAVDAYRGAGRPEANYIMERLMDKIAHEMGMSRQAVRHANVIKPDQLPYKMIQGGEIDSGDMPGLLDDALEKADWAGFAARKAESVRQGKWRGIGLAMYLESCGNGKDGGVDIVFEADGRVTIHASQMDNGQGHQTTLTQIFSSQLSYDADLITVKQGDSKRSPDGTTGGARMAAVLGSTTYEAAAIILKKAQELAAAYLETDLSDLQFDEGIFRTSGHNQTIAIEDLVRELADEDAETHPLDLAHSYATKGASYPYGCHIAEIEIDSVTMVPVIQRYTVVDDFGKVINPLTLEGQIHGGIAQGVGQALYEHMPYDEAGQLLAGSLMDYTLPRADHLPSFDIYTRNTPCLNNIMGVKGSGEAGAIGAPPAVISAVSDALGILHIDMPATPQHIWQAVKAKKDAA